MVRAKGLVILLAILFGSILLGYFLIRINPNYPEPGKLAEVNKVDKSSTTQLDWLEYVPPSKNFKVKLPTLPQSTAKTFTDPKTQEKRNYEVYVSEGKDGAVYMINIITFSDLKSGIQEDDMLTEVANDMMTTHPDNKLIKTEAGKFLGHPSLTFSLAGPKLEINTLTFVNGKILYVLTRVSPVESTDRKEFNFFTSSFELTSRS